LLRQLPYCDPERLVWIWATLTDRDKVFYSIPNFIDTRERNQTLEEMAAFANWGANLTGNGEPQRLQGVRLSSHAFQMLGVEAALGRALIAQDDQPGQPRVVALSYRVRLKSAWMAACCCLRSRSRCWRESSSVSLRRCRQPGLISTPD
jgi:putative ABC transport system permease protein